MVNFFTFNVHLSPAGEITCLSWQSCSRTLVAKYFSLFQAAFAKAETIISIEGLHKLFIYKFFCIKK
jgi:hypothetical protein